MERTEARVRNEQRELQRTDDRSRRAEQHRARAFIGEERQGDAEQQDIGADRQRSDRIERAADEDHPQAPPRAADERRDREPRPAAHARDAGHCGDGQRQIDGEQGDVGFERADERRRGEAARQPEQRARRSEAQRQGECPRRDQRQQDESEQRADQAIDIRRDHNRRIKRRDTRARQGLRHAHVAQPAFVAPGIFGTADQRDTEEDARNHLHARREDARKKAEIDRIENDEDTRDRERDTTGPYR